MAEQKQPYSLNIGGCTFGHDNPSLRAFLNEHSQYVPVKYAGKRARLTGPSFNLDK